MCVCVWGGGEITSYDVIYCLGYDGRRVWIYPNLYTGIQ